MLKKFAAHPSWGQKYGPGISQKKYGPGRTDIISLR